MAESPYLLDRPPGGGGRPLRRPGRPPTTRSTIGHFDTIGRRRSWRLPGGRRRRRFRRPPPRRTGRAVLGRVLATDIEPTIPGTARRPAGTSRSAATTSSVDPLPDAEFDLVHARLGARSTSRSGSRRSRRLVRTVRPGGWSSSRNGRRASWSMHSSFRSPVLDNLAPRQPDPLKAPCGSMEGERPISSSAGSCPGSCGRRARRRRRRRFRPDARRWCGSWSGPTSSSRPERCCRRATTSSREEELQHFLARLDDPALVLAGPLRHVSLGTTPEACRAQAEPATLLDPLHQLRLAVGRLVLVDDRPWRRPCRGPSRPGAPAQPCPRRPRRRPGRRS